MLSLILTFHLHINICEISSIWTVLELEYVLFVIGLQWPEFKFHNKVLSLFINGGLVDTQNYNYDFYNNKY